MILFASRRARQELGKPVSGPGRLRFDVRQIVVVEGSIDRLPIDHLDTGVPNGLHLVGIIR